MGNVSIRVEYLGDGQEVTIGSIEKSDSKTPIVKNIEGSKSLNSRLREIIINATVEMIMTENQMYQNMDGPPFIAS